MTEQDFLRLAALIIAAGGVLEVFRRYLIAPIVAGVRKFVALIRKMADDIEQLLERVGAVEKTTEAVRADVDEMKVDVAEIKGALKGAGILPDDAK